MEREAMLYLKLPGRKVRCNICQRRCLVDPGRTGFCRMRLNRDGVLYTMNYSAISSLAVDPIEKKPLFHFFPGSKALSLGGWGCNFHCLDCQNWEIACVDMPEESRKLAPEEAVELAMNRGCDGIAWTYNEPSLWFEYTLDSARLARQKGLYTVYVTNGYLTPEALDAIGPYLDAWRVDIKGFSDEFYRKLAGLTHWRGILDVARRANEKWGMHVEVVTNIIPGMNDDEEQLSGIAAWICDNLGELTPWHLTRFYPMHKLDYLQPTPIATLEKAYAIGKKLGLKFIYLGNVPGHQYENTRCYSCGEVIIRRAGYDTEVLGLDGSNCRFCDANLNFKAELR